MIATYTEEQFARARLHADLMQAEAVAINRRATGGAAAGVEMEVPLDILAEIVLADALGRKHTGGYERLADLNEWRPDVGRNVDVKRAKKTLYLNIKEPKGWRYPEHAVFVMAYLDGTQFHYFGWIAAYDAVCDDNWNTYAPKPCWSIPRVDLNPMSTLEVK